MICINCSKEFTSKRNPNQKCCSRSCNAKHHNKILGEKFVPPKCKQCGNPTRRESRAVFCSENCKRLSVVGSGNPMWKKGITRHSDGYVYVRIDGKYVLEHRAKMAEYIGRPLTKKEVVHHINGNKSDNRIENLELFTSQAEHIKMEGHILGKKYKVTIQLTNDSPL